MAERRSLECFEGSPSARRSATTGEQHQRDDRRRACPHRRSTDHPRGHRTLSPLHLSRGRYDRWSTCSARPRQRASACSSATGMVMITTSARRRGDMSARTGQKACPRALPLAATFSQCGAGTSVDPALWGARSYTIGASIARIERAASFIRHNMPSDRLGSLTDQQAYDVAAFIDSYPRLDLPGKERDWPGGGAPADVPYATPGGGAPADVPYATPGGGAPADVPYATPGRAPHRPPPVLPRAQRSTSSSSRKAVAGVPSGAVMVSDRR